MATDPVTWVAAGIEVAADRQRTWTALAGVGVTSRNVVVDMQSPLHGTLVVAALVKLREDRDLQHLALDPRSPSSTLVEPLKAEGMPLKLADTAGVATAHGMFADYLNAGRLRIRGHPALDEAARAAEARKLAGAVAPDRYAPAVDQAPLMAAELACWALGDPETAEGITPGAWAL